MKRDLLLCWLVFCFLLASCAAPSFEETPASEFGDAQLYPVTSTGFKEVYARRDAGLAGYRQILSQDLGLSDVRFSGPLLSGTTAGQWSITERRGETLQSAWRSAIDLAFSDYQQVEEGERVLRIEPRLVAVQRRNASVTGTSPTGLQEINRFDGVSLEARIWDSIEARRSA